MQPFVTTSCGVLLLCVSANAQLLDIESALRSVETETHGFDYEYDDGILITAQSQTPIGPWVESRVADQVDYWGFDVATARADQSSAVGTDVIELDASVMTNTAGQHFSADARAESAFEVHFTLTDRLRFDASFAAQSTLGYNTANVSLRLEQGPTLVTAQGDYGATDSSSASGWLAPGSYVLSASTEAFAYGTHNQSVAHSGQCTALLNVFHELDYNRDGFVLRRDGREFQRAYFLGHPSADFDDNGTVDAQDWIAFAAAWVAY